MENQQHSNTESVYACPMHPEVTGKHTADLTVDVVKGENNNGKSHHEHHH